MIESKTSQIRMRVLVVDDEHRHCDSRRSCDPDLDRGPAEACDRYRRSNLRRGRQVGHHVGLRHPCRAHRLERGRRRQGTRRRPLLHPVPAFAKRQDSHLPDGRAQGRLRPDSRSDGAGRRVHLDARRHGGIRQRSRAGRDPPLWRGHAAADGRGHDEVHPGLRILVAHAGTPGWHRIPEVAGRPGLLRLFRRKRAALRHLDQRRQPGLAARPHGSRSASTRSTRPACSVRIGPIASPTARRCRTA